MNVSVVKKKTKKQKQKQTQKQTVNIVFGRSPTSKPKRKYTRKPKVPTLQQPIIQQPPQPSPYFINPVLPTSSRLSTPDIEIATSGFRNMSVDTISNLFKQYLGTPKIIRDENIQTDAPAEYLDLPEVQTQTETPQYEKPEEFDTYFNRLREDVSFTTPRQQLVETSAGSSSQPEPISKTLQKKGLTEEFIQDQMVDTGATREEIIDMFRNTYKGRPKGSKNINPTKRK